MQTYQAFFSSLLAFEMDEMRRAAGQQIMYGVEITPKRFPTSTSSQRGATILWQLRIPGTREDSPRLMMNDTLWIRGLYRRLRTATETAVEARITGTIKRQGLVFFECPALDSMDRHLRMQASQMPGLPPGFNPSGPSPNSTSPIEYIVEFHPSSDGIKSMHRAVRHISSCFWQSLWLEYRLQLVIDQFSYLLNFTVFGLFLPLALLFVQFAIVSYLFPTVGTSILLSLSTLSSGSRDAHKRQASSALARSRYPYRTEMALSHRTRCSRNKTPSVARRPCFAFRTAKAQSKRRRVSAESSCAVSTSQRTATSCDRWSQ